MYVLARAAFQAPTRSAEAPDVGVNRIIRRETHADDEQVAICTETEGSASCGTHSMGAGRVRVCRRHHHQGRVSPKRHFSLHRFSSG